MRIVYNVLYRLSAEIHNFEHDYLKPMQLTYVRVHTVFDYIKVTTIKYKTLVSKYMLCVTQCMQNFIYKSTA